MPSQSDCNRCNGTGLYAGTRRDGSTYTGPCFACQGGGPRRAYRSNAARRDYARANMTVLQAAAAPVYTPRQQASLDAFAASNPAAMGWLDANAPTSDFAASLRNGIARYGNLTPRQLECVMRNLDGAATVPRAPSALPSDSAIGFADPLPPVALDIRTVDPEGDARNAPAPVAPVAPLAPVTVNLDRVRAAMESARASGLRKVALTFGPVTMKFSGPSFRGGNGMILCYHNGSYAGYVDAGNVWRERFSANVSTESLDAFRAVGADPQAAARTHGLDTGNCSCCRRLLTDPVSVMAGIGPVCIRRFGWNF